MRKVRELLRLCIEQEISARQGAKIIGIGKAAASQYVSGFKASGLSLASLEAMSDTELLTILNLKRESENFRYNELCNEIEFLQKWFTYVSPNKKKGSLEYLRNCLFFRLSG